MQHALSQDKETKWTCVPEIMPNHQQLLGGFSYSNADPLPTKKNNQIMLGMYESSLTMDQNYY